MANRVLARRLNCEKIARKLREVGEKSGCKCLNFNQIQFSHLQVIYNIKKTIIVLHLNINNRYSNDDFSKFKTRLNKEYQVLK